MNEIFCCKCGEPAAFPKGKTEPWTCLQCKTAEQPASAAAEKPKAVSSSELVLRHKWIIHYADERGQAHHHQTIFEHEVREIAGKALEAGMVSLTVLRTLNPVP